MLGRDRAADRTRLRGARREQTSLEPRPPPPPRLRGSRSRAHRSGAGNGERTPRPRRADPTPGRRATPRLKLTTYWIRAVTLRRLRAGRRSNPPVWFARSYTG